MTPEVSVQRRIWWIDNGLFVASVVLFFLTCRRFLDLLSAQFNDNWLSIFLGLFIYLFITTSLFLLLRIVMDRLLNTGRKLVFVATLKYVVLLSIIISVACFLLISVSSKTADFLF